MFLSYVVDVGPDRFTFEQESVQLSIPVFTSHSLTGADENLAGLIIIVHGAGLNAGKSFDTASSIIQQLGVSREQYVVVAPQFLEGIEPEEKGLLFWGRRWRSGGTSLSEDPNQGLPGVSSFEVMDRLTRSLAENDPGVQRVWLIGHSAGGQFVSRYAAVNNIHEILHEHEISISYVVANPSSYLYLDASRYRLRQDGEIVQVTTEGLAICDGFDDYKY